MNKQQCRYCGAVISAEQHSRNCPRFLSCQHCGNDIDNTSRRRGNTKYHPWCATQVDDGIMEGIRA